MQTVCVSECGKPRLMFPSLLSFQMFPTHFHLLSPLPAARGQSPFAFRPPPASAPGTECLAAPCMSGAGSFWTGERLPFPCTCARAGGDSGDSPLVWVRASFSLGTVDIWGWIFVCREGHCCVVWPSPSRSSRRPRPENTCSGRAVALALRPPGLWQRAPSALTFCFPLPSSYALSFSIPPPAASSDHRGKLRKCLVCRAALFA